MPFKGSSEHARALTQGHARSKVSLGGMAAWQGSCLPLGWKLSATLSLLWGTNCVGIMHTGQDCDVKDYRKIQTVSHQREVNENFATDLIAEPTWVIVWDGGGGYWSSESVCKLEQSNKKWDLQLLWTTILLYPRKNGLCMLSLSILWMYSRRFIVV